MFLLMRGAWVATDVDSEQVRLAELVAALSLGIDLGFGQPMEHVLRQCLIALRLAEALGLDDDDRAVVYVAKLAEKRADHAEIKDLADAMIGAQGEEISQLRAWGKAWFGSDRTPGIDAMPMLPGMEMSGGAMTKPMDMTRDVEALTSASPFRQGIHRDDDKPPPDGDRGREARPAEG